MKTQNSPWTNAVGSLFTLAALAGISARWFWPDAFHGTWGEISAVGLVGLLFLFGLGDDFLDIVLRKFKKNDKLPS